MVRIIDFLIHKFFIGLVALITSVTGFVIWLDTTIPTGIFDEIAYALLNGLLIWMVARARKGQPTKEN